MVDFHNHILPRIDDGSQSDSQSLKKLELFAELGVEKIIASTHIYKELHPNTPKIIQTAYVNDFAICLLLNFIYEYCFNNSIKIQCLYIQIQ